MSGTLREEFRAQLEAIVEDAEAATEEAVTQTPPKRRLKRTAQLSQQESFERLEKFLEEAEAGAPDEWLALQAGVTLDSVLWWRREKGITHKRGPRTAKDTLMAAGFGLKFDPALHAADSDLNGAWAAPQYLLRKPITYREFCRHIYVLHVHLGTGPELLSEAFGVRPMDIELAISVWNRHLQEKGTPCATCRELTDPRYSKYCSVRCAEAKT